jgi:hexosaminidase
VLFENVLLLPDPQKLSLTGGSFRISENDSIIIEAADTQSLLFTANQLQVALKKFAGVTYAIRGAGNGAIVFSVVPGSVQHPQGYELTITDERVFVTASTAQGCFYGAQTLIQLIDQFGRGLPQLRCSDWPDYVNRGVMLDISRDKVPTMETLYYLVDMLASWKINQFQLYTEHTFAYQNHKTVWENASPITGEEILLLDAYCQERFVELVPNQNTFGHMNRWLRHEEYLPLAEAPDGAMTPWDDQFNPEPFSISPVVPESLELVREMLDELLPHFSSRQVNVGCDETYDLGQGKSEALSAEIGVDRVYLEFLLKIFREVKARGRVMQFWGDIIMEHPDLVPELPRDVIALEWGYEAEHPFDEHARLFAASGIPFYVCPGTSSWRTVAGRTDNALENIRNAAENGLKYGAVGFLNTDWGDEGHWQPLPVSYLCFAYGAAVSWGYANNQEIQIQEILDRFVFRDQQKMIGKLVFDLGNIYQVPDILVPNSSILFQILQRSPEEIAQFTTDPMKASQALLRTRDELDEILTRLQKVELVLPDAELVQQELSWAAKFLHHACDRGIWVIEATQGKKNPVMRANLLADAIALIVEFEKIWLARNRPGGFAESLARMQNMRSAYLGK